MTVIGYRRWAILASLLVGLMAWVAWRLAIQCGMQRADERDSWGAVHAYARSTEVALHSEPQAAASLLYEIAYLPPRRTNSPLEKLVDRERSRGIRAVIAYLRQKTGEDLGDDPRKWIEKYDPGELGP